MKEITLPTPQDNQNMDVLQQRFFEARKAVSEAAKKDIIAIVRQLVPDGETLDASALLDDMNLDNVYKYDCPKAGPCNFAIVGACVQDGKISFPAVDTWDEDAEWTFDESSLTAEEWIALREYFSNLAELFNDEEVTIDEDYRVETAE